MANGHIFEKPRDEPAALDMRHFFSSEWLASVRLYFSAVNVLHCFFAAISLDGDFSQQLERRTHLLGMKIVVFV
jgi:hypothetical protein